MRATRAIQRALILVASLCALVVIPTIRTDAAPLVLSGLVQVDAGAGATCGVFTTGGVVCWGSGNNNELGYGQNTNRATATTVGGINNAVKVSVGGAFACALLTTHQVKCWGDNTLGQLGDGGYDHPALPVLVAGISDAVDLDLGMAHACVVRSGHTVKCWGDNSYEQIGQVQSLNGIPTPSGVSGISSAKAIGAGGRHTCVILLDTTLRCWGDNRQGQIGNGSNSITIKTPVSPGISNIVSVTGGADHTCAVMKPLGGSSSTWCWGSNSSGASGLVNTSKVPAVIQDSPSTGTTVVAYFRTTCLVLADTTVKCWGDNLGGHLGANLFVPYSSTPVTVSGLSGAVGLAVGNNWACANLSNKTAKCWGLGAYGVLGTGTDDQQNTPADVIAPVLEYVALNPMRIADTRPTGVTFDGAAAKTGLVKAGATLVVPVRNRASVSGNVTTTLLHVIAVGAAKAGSVTVWPCDQPKPAMSNLSMLAGPARANLAIGRLATTGAHVGAICLSPKVNTHLIVDVEGYYRPTSSFNGVVPKRLFDSRPSGSTVDGLGKGSGALKKNVVYTITVGGRGGVPAGAGAVALNITAINTKANGTLTVWPCELLPSSPNMSLRKGEAISNLVFVKVVAGKVCVRSKVNTDLLVDVHGYHSTPMLFQAPVAYRLSDSRPTGTTFDGTSKGYGPVAKSHTTQIQVAQRTFEQTTVARAVVLTVTAVNPAAAGTLTVYPCGIPRPAASSLNVSKGANLSTTVVVRVGQDNSVCVYNSMKTDLVVDANGFWFY